MNVKNELRPCGVLTKGEYIPALFHCLAKAESNKGSYIKKGETVAFVEFRNGITDYVHFDRIFFLDSKEVFNNYDFRFLRKDDLNV
ncbi:MAG: hypothetical protein E7391_09160 [Ruminococcaceae bacterium]|nr:hypothetical protein [Oscillospiraceae bacterium]